MNRTRRRGRASQALTARVLEVYGSECWLQLPGCTLIATTKDHVIPYAHGGTDDLENFRPCCANCNSARQDKVISGYGASIKVVTGPPAGGKNTLIRERARPGDIIIDLDALAAALMAVPSTGGDHKYPAHVRRVALGARRAAMDRATRLKEFVNVWIIHSVPKPDQLAEYRKLRYEIIECDPGEEIVRNRAAIERPTASTHGIDRWYASKRTQSQPAVRPGSVEPSRSW